MNARFFYLVPLAVIALAACAPAAPGGSSAAQDTSATVSQSRTLRIVARVEAPSFAEPGGASKVAIPLRMFTAGLAAKDSSETPYPVLAETLPQLNTDSWKVFPDGKMETTYHLRTGLTWHDGRPLTADDFAFALRAYRVESRWVTSPSGDERKSAPFMDEIVAPDAQTVVIRWARAYPGATDLTFQPMPRHVLETWLDQDDSDAYYAHDYWTTGYVGAGPYRLARWERNAFMEGTAFEGYALGRPRIDRIVLTFSDRPPTTVARLLADDIDMAVDRAIEFQEASTLRQEWAARTQGRFLLSPIQLRYVQVQARPAYADPQAFLDVRARRALLHAIDRPSLAEAMVDDRGMAAETMVPPVVGYYAAADRAITKYPYDVRRTEQLMTELGYPKAADGILVSSTAGRLSPELGGLSEGQEAQDTTIVADYLKRAGIDARLNLIPAAMRSGPQADEMTATFPALNTNNNSLNPPMLAMEKFTSATIGTPANNWRGTNKMGWSTPEYDRLANAFTSTLDSKEGDALMVQMLVMASNELPALPLYFNFSVAAHVGSLHGPEAATPSSTLYYNIHQWEWR
jgi:peptide/nickel transport system substrate-binding protein